MINGFYVESIGGDPVSGPATVTVIEEYPTLFGTCRHRHNFLILPETFPESSTMRCQPPSNTPRISIRQAISELRQMFPSFDEDVITEVLSANNLNLGATIEILVAMGGDNENECDAQGDSVTADVIDQFREPVSAEATTVGVPETSAVYVGESHAQHANAASDTTRHTVGSCNYRGKKTALPGDFLRIPPSSMPNDLTADEQLAWRILRDDLQNRNRQVNARVLWRPIVPPYASSAPRQDKMPDFGIMRGLNAIGECAKKNYESIVQTWKAPKATEDAPSEREMQSYGPQGQSLVMNDDENMQGHHDGYVQVEHTGPDELDIPTNSHVNSPWQMLSPASRASETSSPEKRKCV